MTQAQLDKSQPASCRGEKCSMCGDDAYHKVEEVFFDDDPNYPVTKFHDHVCPGRHPYTAYVCKPCFGKIMGPWTVGG